MSLNDGTLLPWQSGFFHTIRLRISSLLSPQAVSSQPRAVLSLGLLPKPLVPAPSPRLHRGHTSQAGARTVCVGLILSCHRPGAAFSCKSPQSSPSVPSDLPAGEGVPRMQEPLLSFCCPSKGCRSRPTSSPLFPFFLSSYPVMRGSFLSF